jgi:hypothetical protein
MTGWLLPWWGWIMGFLIATAVAAIENNLRATDTRNQGKYKRLNAYPIQVTMPATETRAAPHPHTTYYLLLENTSSNLISGVSVVLDGIKRLHDRHTTRMNLEFNTDKGASFSLRPGEKAWVTLATSTQNSFVLGPLANSREIRGYTGDTNDIGFVDGSTVYTSIVTDNYPKHDVTLSCLRGGKGIFLGALRANGDSVRSSK